MKIILSLSLLVTWFMSSIIPEKKIEVSNFKPFTNIETSYDTLLLPMDLSDAVLTGITIPTIKQTSSGYFKFTFELKNNTEKPQAFYYKILYQNESYKIAENIKNDGIAVYNKKSSYNFYGSWENNTDTFHISAIIPNDNKPHIIVDSFRIVGNPRNEEQYFGADNNVLKLTKENIETTMKNIKNTKEWYHQIEEKALKNKITSEKQLYNDALWVLKDESLKGNKNNRWKRNPRVGNYSFTLIVATKGSLSKIPVSIRNICKNIKNDYFISPFFEMEHNKLLKDNPEIKIIRSKYVLKTYANFDLSKGIYINEFDFDPIGPDCNFYNKNCGCNKALYSTAQFEQFKHSIVASFNFKNIPIIADVKNDNYSQEDYKKNIAIYEKGGMVEDYIHVTSSPCKTVGYDNESKSILIKTPGNENKEIPTKENVGIKSRIGFTYGKYFARIKFPAIINNDNVWDGLTCAYWLIYQGEGSWNFRSTCEDAGYIPKSEDGQYAKRVKKDYYSEIDFEILKTTEFWPKTSYAEKVKVPTDDPKSNRNIMVTCTNWDLACRSPQNYIVGAHKIKHQEKQFVLHRWDDWYKALTSKYAINHDSIFDRYYYYEIDWQPERIIWRIGLDKQHMIEVGYMDNTVTAIPDNQMIMVLTQEFHDSKWWPLSPFHQNYIPYPKSDIVGEISEFTIE